MKGIKHRPNSKDGGYGQGKTKNTIYRQCE